MLKIGHTVRRPARKMGDPPVTIPVAAELETVPGIPQHPKEVDWYSKEFPLESHNVENRAYRQWVDTVTDIRALRREHEKLNRVWVTSARISGELLASAITRSALLPLESL